ncbi:glycerol-3-phosphate 1-O-acyltransferase PlsY [Peribacillus frigoritolerans]|uniref:glycerol-3-phosphate 1-O-acyltransferase PlsY n=1 Tax=Peribacillus frigoritolerans TaxID=450367 RepID=UPI0023DA5E33|nr:glycerol-3-phosphate 1-O-acyltransferase PlsY [Peribacillus frigoritolerans]MDF1997741.1 glycerol-3-phosphate 1-O-acyltransferase PlsY [Peribacillus frigoritolerans]
MLVFLVVFSYLLGSIPTALIVGKAGYGIDIRKQGSGNLGATNTFRTLGVKAGIIVTVVDILKGTTAGLLPVIFSVDINILLIGLFASIGHSFPIFAKFKGGKAVATSSGVLLAYDYRIFLITILIFIISLYLFKMVSLASIISSVIIFIYALIFSSSDIILLVVLGVLSIFVIYRHKENIKRIKNNTEPKIKWLG